MIDKTSIEKICDCLIGKTFVFHNRLYGNDEKMTFIKCKGVPFRHLEFACDECGKEASWSVHINLNDELLLKTVDSSAIDIELYPEVYKSVRLKFKDIGEVALSKL